MNLCFQIIKEGHSFAQNNQRDHQSPFPTQAPHLLLQNGQPSNKNTKNRTNTTKILYNWNKREDRKYLKFLMRHGHLFALSKEQRKSMKINVMMSENIKSRSPAQCHTHHQKMMLKFGSIDNIIANHRYLLHHNRQIKPTSPSTFKQSNSNQSCQRPPPKNRDIDSNIDQAIEPYWSQYVGLYSRGESSFHPAQSWSN